MYTSSFDINFAGSVAFVSMDPYPGFDIVPLMGESILWGIRLVLFFDVAVLEGTHYDIPTGSILEFGLERCEWKITWWGLRWTRDI